MGAAQRRPGWPDRRIAGRQEADLGCIWTPAQNLHGRGRRGPNEVLLVSGGALGRPGALLELQELLDQTGEDDELIDRVGGPAARPGQKTPDRPVDDGEAGPPGPLWRQRHGEGEGSEPHSATSSRAGVEEELQECASEPEWSTGSEAWNYSLESSPIASFAFVPPPLHSDEEDGSSSLPDLDFPAEAPRRAMRPFGGARPKHRRVPAPLQEAEPVEGSSPSSLFSQTLLPVEEAPESTRCSSSPSLMAAHGAAENSPTMLLAVPKTARGSPPRSARPMLSARNGSPLLSHREAMAGAMDSARLPGQGTAKAGVQRPASARESRRSSLEGKASPKMDVSEPIAEGKPSTSDKREPQSSRRSSQDSLALLVDVQRQLSGTPRTLIPAPTATPRPPAKREEPLPSAEPRPEAPIFLNGSLQGSHAYSVQAAELRISMEKAPSIARTQVIEFNSSRRPVLPPLALHLIRRDDGDIAPGTYDGEQGGASTDSGEMSSSSEDEPRTRPGMQLPTNRSTGSRTPRPGSARSHRRSATPRSPLTSHACGQQRSGSLPTSRSQRSGSLTPVCQPRSGNLTPKALSVPTGLRRSGRSLDPEDVSLEVLSAWLTELEAGERRMRASLEAQTSGNLSPGAAPPASARDSYRDTRDTRDTHFSRNESMRSSKSAKPTPLWVEPWNSDFSETPEANRRRRHRKMSERAEAKSPRTDSRKVARCPFSPSSARPSGLAKLLGCFAK